MASSRFLGWMRIRENKPCATKSDLLLCLAVQDADRFFCEADPLMLSDAEDASAQDS